MRSIRIKLCNTKPLSSLQYTETYIKSKLNFKHKIKVKVRPKNKIYNRKVVRRFLTLV